MRDDPILFALNSSEAFGEGIARGLGIPLAAHEEREFEGGEHKARPLDEVGGREVYVVHSLHGEPGASANDKLIRLLFFIGALKDAGAARVTAVVPYLAYSRKDRRTKPRDPVSSRYVAGLFESLGTDRILTIEAHNISAFENAFRTCRPEHLALARLFARHLATRLGDGPVAVVSPDAGGNKRAELLRHELEASLGRPIGKAIMDKHRSKGVVSGHYFAGDVAGAVAIIVDDLISSGGTILRACKAAREAGAADVLAIAAHGMFTLVSPLFSDEQGPDTVIVTDTIPLASELADEARAKIEVLEAAPLVASVIERLHSGEPVSELLPYD
ncbi:ribose-phosphate diphosphokinase [Erythrobacter sp.]|uniref:ribose-phosphate diphosphokinase n=1 Tax=Erythrobacter sp. TaxID=1042 RepID=UPI001B0E3275|nr:ribose-phosphate diphosphokinase [Erythrobacter sp.]MBO6525452.1 ribose-phosphate pyrophosphokinase [Erythrobacter sp.]MBO6529875.1 ribose-phosphate pyrophosphokinase [Erythrobacter sp.]